MPDNITAITDGADNRGGLVESDNDLTDNNNDCNPTGYVDVAAFPAAVPPIGEQESAAARRAPTSPNGADATAQTYSAVVPFSGTALKLGAGSSAGGAGASLTTGENVFVGATGKLGMQSVGAFTGQTNAAMGLYSVAGTNAHSQSTFEIYSGGGMAPGACGTGGPAAPVDKGKPAQGAEAVTNTICATAETVKALNDLANVGLEGEINAAAVIEGTKAVVETSGKLVSIFGPSAGAGEKTMETVGKTADTSSGVLEAAGGLVNLKEDPLGGLSAIVTGISAISGAQEVTSFLNPEGPHPKAAGAAGLVPGATPPAPGGEGGGGGGGEGGGGGAFDIEERAAGAIHMCANVKINGTAPEAIEWKTAGAFLATAIAQVDFQTTNFEAFAAAMFRIRSGALIDVKCRKFEMKAWAKGKLKTPITTVTAATLSKLDGKTEVTGTLTVLDRAQLHGTLEVKKNTLIKDNLTIKKEVTNRKDVKIHKAVSFKQQLTINGTHSSNSQLKAKTEGKLG